MEHADLRDVIRDAVRDVINEHGSCVCPFSSEQTGLLKDMASGAKLAKTVTIRAVVFAILLGAATALVAMMAKVLGVSAWISYLIPK